MYVFGLHLAANAVTKFFDTFTVFVALDVFDEGFNSVFRILARVNVFITPYRIFALVCIFKAWFYTFDGEFNDALIVD